VTNVYGNNHYLFTSAYFWLSQPLVIAIALLPRYLYRAWQLGYAPGDLEILRYIRKTQPDLDMTTLRSESMRSKPYGSSRPRPSSHMSRSSIACSSVDNLSLDLRRTQDPRCASRTDMSTGIRSVHRGFDFATEEGGVAMRRMQTNLSERRQSSRNLPSLRQSSPTRKRSLRLFTSLRRKKSPTLKKDD
jgi:phospholipid-translocating ATPase